MYTVSTEVFCPLKQHKCIWLLFKDIAAMEPKKPSYLLNIVYDTKN